MVIRPTLATRGAARRKSQETTESPKNENQNVIPPHRRARTSGEDQRTRTPPPKPRSTVRKSRTVRKTGCDENLWRCNSCRRTTLLSDAPPREPELKPGRNRRAHWSSLDRRFRFIWFWVVRHSSCEVELSGVRSDSNRLQSSSACLCHRHLSWPGSMSRPQS